jgi:hypothetical protein
MTKYISKDALVAEIERRLNELYDLLPDASKVENGMITISEACNTGKYTALESFRRFLDTLEVKEVDLEKEIDKEIETRWRGEYLFTSKFRESAKHFFELGLKESNPLTWQDVKLLSEIGEDFMNSWESNNFSEEEYYQEILKRFKAQKGEEV